MIDGPLPYDAMLMLRRLAIQSKHVIMQIFIHNITTMGAISKIHSWSGLNIEPDFNFTGHRIVTILKQATKFIHIDGLSVNKF